MEEMKNKPEVRSKFDKTGQLSDSLKVRKRQRNK